MEGRLPGLQKEMRTPHWRSVLPNRSPKINSENSKSGFDQNAPEVVDIGASAFANGRINDERAHLSRPLPFAAQFCPQYSGRGRAQQSGQGPLQGPQRSRGAGQINRNARDRALGVHWTAYAEDPSKAL